MCHGGYENLLEQVDYERIANEDEIFNVRRFPERIDRSLQVVDVSATVKFFQQCSGVAEVTMERLQGGQHAREFLLRILSSSSVSLPLHEIPDRFKSATFHCANKPLRRIDGEFVVRLQALDQSAKFFKVSIS
jgi:hypothetical protein